MKKLLTLLVVLFATLAFVSCGEEELQTNDIAVDGKYQVAVVTDVGQLKDAGFNQGTYEGARAYAVANGKGIKYYQPANGSDATDDDRIAAMRLAVEGGAEVIVTPGFMQAAALQTVAAEHPEVKFVFVDGWNLGLANVTAVSYKEHESGYFAGYAAVKDGYTKLGGTFGGGGSNAACNRFAYGYLQGAQAAAAELNKTVEVKVSFKYGSGFSASPELQTQISGWYNAGTEVVFACGGSMLQSVKAACAETTNGKIIGVDVDQAGESKRVITSAFKGLSSSVQLILGQFYNGEWDSKLADKTQQLGAADNATGLPTAKGSWRLSKFSVKEYEALFNKVKNGTVVVKDDVAADVSTAAAWTSYAQACPNVTFVFE